MPVEGPRYEIKNDSLMSLFVDKELGCERFAADVFKRRTDPTPTAKLGRRTLDRVCLDRYQISPHRFGSIEQNPKLFAGRT